MNRHATDRAVVLGLGRSGEAAAALLLDEGAAVTVLDASRTPVLEERARALAARGARVTLASPETLPADAFDLCIVSPGVPADAAWVRAARARGLRVVPELELGWARRRSRVLAVTGSNGKSTAVKWLTEALLAAGVTAEAGGNYGRPVCELVRGDHAPDWLVLEVSSFQLEIAENFRPEVGVLLNVQPNHFDRHGNLGVYLEAKTRLFARMTPADVAVVPRDCFEQVERAAAPAAPGWRVFGAGPSSRYRYDQGLVLRDGEPLFSVRGTGFENEVLGLTAAAVGAALDGAGVPLAAAETAARAFVPLPHRMALVVERDGVRYVDDSKATSLAALAAALRMTPGAVRLIAGGRLKEDDLLLPKECLAARVRRAYLIGEAAKRLFGAWSPFVACCICDTLEAAMRAARAEAQAGETILLSPGCASFDQFRGYAERGEVFARLAAEPGAEKVQAQGGGES